MIRRTLLRAAAGCCVVALALLAAAPAAAQHWSFDARRIALGDATRPSGPARPDSLRRRPYRSILLPFRLVQILRDIGIYNPYGRNFAPVRATTNLLSPLHFAFDQDIEGPAQILNDLLTLDLDDDIRTYLDLLDVHLPDLSVILEVVEGVQGGSDAASGGGGAFLRGPGRGGAVVPGGALMGRDLATGIAAGVAPSPDAFDVSAIPDIRIQLLDSSWNESYLDKWSLAWNWGRTFTVHETPGGVVHGVYVGGGPWLSLQADAGLDASFRSFLDVKEVVRSAAAGGISPDVLHLDMAFDVDAHALTQMAAAITGGYRLRLPLRGRPASARDGIYVAVNYNHLQGFRYEHFGATFDVAFDSAAAGDDAAGPSGHPVGALERLTGRSGRGLAIDAGVLVAMDRWDVGFGVDRLANRITWTDVRRGVLPLDAGTLQGGGGAGAFDDLKSPGARTAPRRVTAPVRYTADAAYHAPDWTAMGTYARGFAGHEVHAGLEYRLSHIELRGGGLFKGDRWHPTGGVGFELAPGWHLDMAAFGTSLNPRRARRLALAASLRLE